MTTTDTDTARQPLEPKPPRIVEPYHWTDLGNAKRMVALHGADLRYCHPWGSWLVWNGKKWDRDNTAEIKRRAKDAVMMMHSEAAAEQDDARRRALTLFALKSENTGKLNALIESACSEPGIPILPGDLDQNPWLFNVQNGTIDLITGEIREHAKTDMITKISPVVYDKEATCPQWMKFLDEIMAGNKNNINFLQRAAGYALTGDTKEECMFVLYGTGANGKTKFINVLHHIIGEYALKSDIETFLEKRNRSGANNDIARMHGTRYVHATEPDEGRSLAEGKIKELTGGDVVTARFLYKEGFDFRPQFKLFIGTNYKITIKGTDDGIWRRIQMIPFEVKIPEEMQDKNLEQKLIAEAPGILNWIVQGCLEWQKTGLKAPEDIIMSTHEYRAEMDIYSIFFTHCCEFKKTSITPNKLLYLLFKAWCELEGLSQLTHIKFSRLMSRQPVKRINKETGVAWEGLNLHPGLFKAYAQLNAGATSLEVLEILEDFLTNFSYSRPRETLRQTPLKPSEPPADDYISSIFIKKMEVCSGNGGSNGSDGDLDSPGIFMKDNFDKYNNLSAEELDRLRRLMDMKLLIRFPELDGEDCVNIINRYCKSRGW